MTMTYLPHILAGIAAFAATTLWTLWRIAQNEVDKLSDELTKAAELDKSQRAEIESLRREVDLFMSQKNNANTRAAQFEAEIERLKETIATMHQPRNEKGQFARKPDAYRSERSRKRDRATIRKKTAAPFVVNPERKKHQLLPRHQVKNVTDKQRKAIYDTAISIGLRIAGKSAFFDRKYKYVWFCPFNYELLSMHDVDSYMNINIPFDEFMARLKGQWVEPQTPIK